MKIAVRSPNWIGDCVMAIPALKFLKKTAPDAEIVVVTLPHLQSVFANIDEIDRFIPMNGSSFISNLKGVVGEIKKNCFSEGLLLTNSFSSALQFKLGKVRGITGYDKDYRGFLLDRAFPFPSGLEHHVRFYTDLVEKFAGKRCGTDNRAQLTVISSEQDDIREKLEVQGIDTSMPMLGISPTAAYGPAKMWQPEKFAQLVEALKEEKPELQVMFFGAAHEKEFMDRIILSLGFRKGVFNLGGVFNLRESISAISVMNGFVANDSGLMHVAAGLNVPLVAIFGPTIPERTAPEGDNIKVLHKPPDCWPCKQRECQLGHKCMGAIKVPEVYSACRDIMNVFK